MAYKEIVSGYLSLAGYVTVAHSPLRFGLGAREDGLGVQLLPIQDSSPHLPTSSSFLRFH